MSVISLEAVVLRPLEPRDLAALQQFRNDPDVISRLGGFSSGYAEQDLRDWLEFHRKQRNEVLWCVASREDDQCLGHVGLYHIDHRVRKAELAILIGPQKSRRRGVGRAVCAAVMRYAERQLNVRRLELTLLASNTAAHSLYESLGFEVEGRFRQAEFRDGAYVDVIAMATVFDGEGAASKDD